jgi:hypothetical protein
MGTRPGKEIKRGAGGLRARVAAAWTLRNGRWRAAHVRPGVPEYVQWVAPVLRAGDALIGVDGGITQREMMAEAWEAQLWYSSDGERWRPRLLDTTAVPKPVASDGHTLLGVSPGVDAALVLSTSSDGRTWRTLPWVGDPLRHGGDPRYPPRELWSENWPDLVLVAGGVVIGESILDEAGRRRYAVWLVRGLATAADAPLTAPKARATPASGPRPE